MTRRLAPLVFLIATVALAQPLPESWAHWRWWRAITSPATKSPRLVAARLPIAVYGRATPDLRDLRVTDGAGSEIAYILHAPTGWQTHEWLDPALTEVSHVAGNHTQALVDLGPAAGRHNRVELLVAEPEPELFARVDVAVRDDDRGAWRVLAEGRPVHRFAGQPADLTVSYGETRARWLRLRIRSEAGAARERFPLRGVRVAFPEARGRYWRVVVHNGDDPPLQGLRTSLRGVPRYVVVRQQPGARYRLLYGNERAATPRYELARLTLRDETEAAAPVELGRQRQNASWIDPRPWTERRPWVLWAALGLAIASLGWLALRSLRAADYGP